MSGLAWIALLLVIVLAAGGGYWWWQNYGPHGSAPLSKSDRFAPAPALSAVEMELLNYLVRAFPGRAVLFRTALSQIVTVRKSENRLSAQQRLTEHSIDYVVCNRDGRPIYAFELDALHQSADEAAQDAREKHRVLKSAGIRLIRLTRTTRDLPDPNDFRRHLRTAELTPDGQPAPISGPGALWPTDDQPAPDSKPAPLLPERAPMGPAGGFRDTQPMTVTGLMNLPAAPDDAAGADPWGASQRIR